MKIKYFLILLFFFTIGVSKAQVDISAGMGVGFVYAPSLNNYIEYWEQSDVQPFSSAAEFYCEIDYSIFNNLQLGVEYIYSLWNYNTDSFGNYSLNYTHQKPSILAYYILAGEGYKFKFGGGFGPRFISLSEKYIVIEKYIASGFGVLIKAQGHTALGDNVYANIGTTVRYDAPGEPENNGNKLKRTEVVNINSFSIIINIGLSYFF